MVMFQSAGHLAGPFEACLRCYIFENFWSSGNWNIFFFNGNFTPVGFYVSSYSVVVGCFQISAAQYCLQAGSGSRKRRSDGYFTDKMIVWLILLPNAAIWCSNSCATGMFTEIQLFSLITKSLELQHFLMSSSLHGFVVSADRFGFLWALLAFSLSDLYGHSVPCFYTFSLN